jgi:hypothetical protein
MTNDVVRGTPLGMARSDAPVVGGGLRRPGTQGDPERRVPSPALPTAAPTVKVRRLHAVDAPPPGESASGDGASSGGGRLPELVSKLPWSSQWLALRRLLAR